MLFGHWIPYGTRPQYRNCKRKKRKETHATHKKQKFLDDTPEDTTPWGIQSTLRAPCKALNPTTRLGNPNKLIQISVRIVLENHKSSRFWFVDITDSDTPQVRPPLEGIAIGLYELKIPQATHWVIFVPQECSATLLRDISARKRCPSAPPEKSLRNLDSWHHQGTAIPRFGESAVPCRIYSTLKSFRHTCRLLSIITVCPKFYLLWVKWSEPRKTLVCPYDLHQGFTDLINRQRMIMPSIIWILVYRLGNLLGCHPSLITMKNHATATPQSLSSIFNQDVISRLLDKCVK